MTLSKLCKTCIPFQMYCLLCIISQYQEYKAGRGCDRQAHVESELKVCVCDINMAIDAWFLIDLNKNDVV